MKVDRLLLLNNLAKKREKEGYDVINGSIGMMYFDDAKLPKNTFIRNTLSRHINDNDLTYSSISGEDEFRTLFFNWFFKDTFSKENVRTLTTQGGTGAIFCSTVAENLIHKNNIYLYPDVGWPNYYGIASSYELDYIEYPIFNDNLEFNIAGILELFNKLLKENRHISFVINDPCHNPSGYSMNNKEWDLLVNFILSNCNTSNFALIVDCAYLDFADKDIREYAVKSIKRISGVTTVHLCLSSSKTFGFYGLRCGELVSISPNTKLLDELREKTIKVARGAWSTPNHMAINTLIEVLSSSIGREEVTNEIKECNNIIKERAKIVLTDSDKYNLKHFPYSKGFFITFVIDNAIEVSDELVKEDIYLSPISEKHLRIALCSVPTYKLIGLMKKVKEVSDRVNKKE